MSGDEKEIYQMPCHECQGGISHLRYQTYVTWLANELITVPNFPTWICDMCGWREFDAWALSWLVTILNPPQRQTRVNRRHPLRQDEPANDRQRPVSE